MFIWLSQRKRGECSCVAVGVWVCVRDWSMTTQLSPSQMVQIWMPAWWFLQPQWEPEWLSEILEELEDRMRHKLDLLTKDNESDTQLSNLISLKLAENIQKEAASQIKAPRTRSVCDKKHLPRHVLSEELAWTVGCYTTERALHLLESLRSDHKSAPCVATSGPKS